ncbi:hypothetical protein Sta7437_4390 [Stanieria cyanosphaera PCC 7437]|uniref:Uncharacterized protein n=2 Tax=Stanieria cyanosphaera TaxID=102116 RepID=K9Y0M7_STAC7|nr:hypothetical protein Sta7437_4390 [Stanieria cyanosphaera PCC 7437]
MRFIFFLLCNVTILVVAGVSLAGEVSSPTLNTEVDPSSEKSEIKSSQDTQFTFTVSPLVNQLFTQPISRHLQQGEVVINFDSRLFFLPDLVPDNGIDDSDTASNYNTGFSWGISDELELTLQFQHVDSSSPARQGNFTSERTEDNEAALELKQKLWQNASGTQSLSGVFSASWGTRGFRLTGGGTTTEVNNRNIYTAVHLPFTATVDRRWQFTVSPTLAFFNEENAEFFQRLPNDDSSFGTVLGLAGAVSYTISPKLTLWGDVFLPLTGNNSISRESGEPDDAIAYNAGLRYFVNPRLALDVYASNTFGSIAPLSLTADRDLMALGTNIVFMPDLFAVNRRQPDRFNSQSQVDNTPITTDGLAFFDGGTLSSGQFLFNLQGGSQGLLTSLRYGVLKDFEAGIYLDYISGETDESEQGLSAKIRLLNQAENQPLTASLATTIGIGNQVLTNFANNDRQDFDRRNLNKEIPLFYPGADDGLQGKEFIFTLSLPLHYQFQNDAAVWLTPMVGYLQRKGTELIGFNVGGSIPLGKEFSVLGEIGANFAGDGNAFIGNSLQNEIPWNIGVRWQPLSLFGLESSNDNSNPQLELYLTNRVGFSTWHQLRVRDQNETAIGLGLSLPF